MSKRCASCGHRNEESRIFCSRCGEPLDVELRLIQDVEKRKLEMSEANVHKKKHIDDEEYEIPKHDEEPKKSSVLPVILGVAVVVVIVAVMFLK